MKRKLPLLLAMAMLAALLCAPVAHAAYAPSPGGEIDIEDPNVPLDELPEVTIYVNAIVNAGTARAETPVEELLEAIEAVNAGEAVRIAIISTGGEGADKQEVVLPQEAIQALVDANVQLRFSTPAGQAILSSQDLASFVGSAGNGDIILVIELRPVEEGVTLMDGQGVAADRIRKGSTNLVYVLCNGTAFYNWIGDSITLYLHAGTGEFEEDSIYTIYQFDANGGNVRTLEGQCVSIGEELRIVVSVDSRLGYFVILPDAVAQNVAVVDPSIIASPLASKTSADNTTTGVWASVQHWFDSVANQLMNLFWL